MTSSRTVFYILMLTVASGSFAADELPLSSLQYDPFKQPAFLRAPQHTKRSAPVPAKPKLQLRSILQAGNESMVNLNGEILMIGDSYQGYQLVEVNKQSALFIKNGEKIKVTLKQ